MKRILALFLSVALLLALLSACSGGSDPATTVVPPDPGGETSTLSPENTTQEPSLSLPSAEPTAESTEEVTDGPSDQPSQEPSQAPSAQPTPSPTPAPTPTPTPTPTPNPTPKPSPSVPPIIGPGVSTDEPTDEPDDPDGFIEPTGPSASDVNLTNFYQTVLDSYAFPAMDVLPTDFVANFYPGLASIPAVQRVVSAPMMTGVAAEITLVQVANSSDVSAVKAILQARVDSQVAGGAFYPMVVESWQNNSRVVSHGNYVMLVVHESCDAIVSQFNALF